MGNLLIMGCGYSGLAIADRWQGEVWGTTRSRRDVLQSAGVHPLDLDDEAAMRDAIARADAIVLSAPPPDPALRWAEDIAHSKAWLGYLSTTAVYGDRGGAWVDETTPPSPASPRGVSRLEAETAWQSASPRVNIFRLAGIYGPEFGGEARGPFEKLKGGRARNIVKAGQVFGRIHVEDIARIVLASYDAKDAGQIYNLTDDEPASPQDVINYAAALLGLAPPGEVPFEEAEMSPMARSFYEENKRVHNHKIRAHFGPLLYPDYRAGLDAIVAKNRE